MRVLHVIPSMASAYGGPARLIERLVGPLQTLDVQSEVLCTAAASDPASELEVPVHALPRLPGPGYLAPAMYGWLRTHISRFDVLHVRAAFNVPAALAVRAALKVGIPVAFQPQGTLDAWSLAYKSWRKRPWLRLVERPVLQRVAVIQVSTRMEADAVHGIHWLQDVPLRVIPPVIPAPDSTDPGLARVPGRILFASRLHPKKGLDILLSACARLPADAVLHIAGSGARKDEAQLRAHAAQLGLEGRVVWLGQLDPAQLRRELACCSVFVLPSLSENFGMAVVEAAASGVPAVASDAVAAAHALNAAGLARLVPAGDVEALALAMQCSLRDTHWQRTVASTGPEYVRQHFAPDAVAAQVAAMYRQAARSRSA